MEWEAQLIEWLQTSLSNAADFAKYFDFFGAETGLLILVLVVNLWLPMIKSVVLRPRPYMEYPDRVQPFALSDEGAAAMDVAAQGYSFPSMHSASIPAVYFWLAKEAKKNWLWIVAGVLTVLVGVSRVVAGMHYPTDVLAGWILGFAVIGVFMLLARIAPDFIDQLLYTEEELRIINY